MDEEEREKLVKAFKKEKRHNVRTRIHMVCMVKINEITVTETAKLFYCDVHTVINQIRRYDEEGLEGLADKSRSGRPTKLKLEKIEKIVKKSDSIVTPKKLNADIKKECGVQYSISNLRKIMRDKLNLSAKTTQTVHINRASIEKIRRWQRAKKAQISRLKNAGYTIVAMDQAIFVDDPVSGVKYWSTKGVPIVTTYKGRHQKLVVFGVITSDGRQCNRIYDKFNKENVVKFLKEVEKKFGKTAIILDNAPQHKAKIVQEYVRNCPNIKLIWLPTSTPELNVTEAMWKQSKYDVLVGKYYSSFKKMCNAISEYFRTKRFGLDLTSFLYRKSLNEINF